MRWRVVIVQRLVHVDVHPRPEQLLNHRGMSLRRCMHERGLDAGVEQVDHGGMAVLDPVRLTDAVKNLAVTREQAGADVGAAVRPTRGERDWLVDRPVDKAVENQRVRGTTVRFLWTSCGQRKDLEIDSENPCAASNEVLEIASVTENGDHVEGDFGNAKRVGRPKLGAGPLGSVISSAAQGS